MAARSKAPATKTVASSGKPSAPTATAYRKAPGQGAGPKLQGASSEMGAAVPGRILETRVVRRASQSSGQVAPGKLVDHGRRFGAK